FQPQDRACNLRQRGGTRPVRGHAPRSRHLVRVPPAHHESRRAASTSNKATTQGTLEVDSHLFMAARVTRAANDKEQLPPTLAVVASAAPVIESVAEVLIDSGFVSE